MSTQVQMRRGTEAENDDFTGAEGEITIDTTNDTIRVHDGIKKGGYPVMKGKSPITPGTYPKITFDKNGLVVGGSQLGMSDLPTSELSKTYILKQEKDASGTFAKVVVNKDGVVTEGKQLEPSDIPELPVSKVADLQTALDGKAEAFVVSSFTNASGSINLKEGVNAVTMAASCTLYPPVVTDPSILRQCVVQVQKNVDEYTITVNANKYFGGVKPDLSSAGSYNIYLEYDVPTGQWVYGAIKKN